MRELNFGKLEYSYQGFYFQFLLSGFSVWITYESCYSTPVEVRDMIDLN